METTGSLQMAESVSSGSMPARRTRVDLRVRYAETDQMGKAHHMRYLSWFELGRIELLRANGISYAELEETGVHFPVVMAEIEYRQSVGYDEEVQIWTNIGELRSCSITFSHEARRAVDGGLLARGRMVVACMDCDGKTRGIPGHVVTSFVG